MMTKTINFTPLKPSPNQPYTFPSYVTNQHALAKYVVDNNLITLALTHSAFDVHGRGG